jgi:hypothetical protein
MAKKTDNHNLPAKLALRRHFLRTFHSDGDIRVLDCCQASGKIWGELRKEFYCRYWGVDVKPKPGRLKIDSVRILEQCGLEQNVIDIDTYGSPWKHWFALLRNTREPLTVFLTIGIGGGNADRALLDALGLTFKTLKIPNAIGARIGETGVAACIARARDFGFEIADCREAANLGGHARYIGVRLSRPDSR